MDNHSHKLDGDQQVAIGGHGLANCHLVLQPSPLAHLALDDLHLGELSVVVYLQLVKGAQT